MIISASRRTDIPAFYAEWFMNRVRAGYCTVPNPFNTRQVSRVDLSPAAVDAIVFWTRNPEPMIPHLDELEKRGLPPVFLVTVTDCPREYEPRAHSQETVLRSFRRISEFLGADRIVWRYDPIILSSVTPPEFHLNVFSRLARKIEGLSRRCIVSVLALYPRVRRRFRELPDNFQLWEGKRLQDGLASLIPELVSVARSCGLSIQSCAEEIDLSPFGVHPGGCIDAQWLSRVLKKSIVAGRDPHQRNNCLCSVARDIGMYDTCLLGCRYCYATGCRERVLRALREHDPLSPSLAGHYEVEKPSRQLLLDLSEEAGEENSAGGKNIRK